MKELDMQNSSVEDNTTEIENDVTVNNNAAEPETEAYCPYCQLPLLLLPGYLYYTSY